LKVVFPADEETERAAAIAAFGGSVAFLRHPTRHP
jgi:hypothetical protein